MGRESGIVQRLAAFARRLWAREPVLVGTLLPVLVTLGVLTQDQASAVTSTITGAAAIAAEVAAAFGIRSRVTPAKKN